MNLCADPVVILQSVFAPAEAVLDSGAIEEAMVIRSELCAIAGLSVTDFNDHLRSGAVPFEMHGFGESRDEQGRTWTNFTLDHAALLLAAQQFVSAGVIWAEAVAILREPRVPVPRSAPLRTGRHCVARAEFMREGGGKPDYRRRFTVYGGPLGDTLAATQAHVEVSNRQSARTGHQKICMTLGIATDLGRARRLAMARADEAGLAPEQVFRIDPDADVPLTSETDV